MYDSLIAELVGVLLANSQSRSQPRFLVPGLHERVSCDPSKLYRIAEKVHRGRGKCGTRRSLIGHNGAHYFSVIRASVTLPSVKAAVQRTGSLYIKEFTILNNLHILVTIFP